MWLIVLALLLAVAFVEHCLEYVHIEPRLFLALLEPDTDGAVVSLDGDPGLLKQTYQ